MYILMNIEKQFEKLSLGVTCAPFKCQGGEQSGKGDGGQRTELIMNVMDG